MEHIEVNGLRDVERPIELRLEIAQPRGDLTPFQLFLRMAMKRRPLPCPKCVILLRAALHR